ncbi:MAG: hypothetical protein JXP34_14645 [Planctomycetes bacterium]|nr:hypothetical protein [Planctomycetota bacterium]
MIRRRSLIPALVPALLLASSCAREIAIPLAVREGKRVGPVSLAIDAPASALPLRPFTLTAFVASRGGEPVDATLEWILPEGIEIVEGEIASSVRIPAAGREAHSLRLRLGQDAAGTIVLRARGADPETPWAREMVLQVGEPAPLPPPYELADGRKLRLPASP